jgi:aerobic-type carbon monoxide dehydrogenase small subunit (CoxS/CutS family)
MSEEKEIKKDRVGITRRKFLKDAGIVVGGTAIGSAFFLSACGEKVEVTKTVTTTAPGATITTTAPGTPGGTATETKTVTKYICPVCSQEFDTLDALKAHFNAEHDSEEGSKTDGFVTISLTVNGVTHTMAVEPCWTLAYLLREKLQLKGTKVACDEGACGACTVGVDGKPCLSCMMLAVECNGKNIETIESFTGDPKKQHILDTFWKFDAVQCGYCTPGLVEAAKLLLDRNSKPTEQDVKEELAGNICRCGTHANVIDAVLALGGTK